MKIMRVSNGNLWRFPSYLKEVQENRELSQYDTNEAFQRVLKNGEIILATQHDETIGCMVLEFGMFGIIRREHAMNDGIFKRLLEEAIKIFREQGITRIQNLADSGSVQRSRMEDNGFVEVEDVALLAKNI